MHIWWNCPSLIKFLTMLSKFLLSLSPHGTIGSGHGYLALVLSHSYLPRIHSHSPSHCHFQLRIESYFEQPLFDGVYVCQNYKFLPSKSTGTFVSNTLNAYLPHECITTSLKSKSPFPYPIYHLSDNASQLIAPYL